MEFRRQNNINPIYLLKVYPMCKKYLFNSYCQLTFMCLLVLLIGINVVYAQPASSPSGNLPTTPTAPSGTVSIFPGLQDYINTSNRNFMREYAPQIATQDENDVSLPMINSANGTPCLVATSYTDGLGRPLQEIVRMGNSSTARDMVKVHAYDSKGREATSYLTYPAADVITNRAKMRTAPLTELRGAYNQYYPGDQPYATITYDNSPLDRPVLSMGAGKTWVGSNIGVQVIYGTDIATGDFVNKWRIGTQTTDLPVFDGYYNTGELFKNTIIDEDGKIVVEYKDKTGHIVCKRTKIGNSSPQVGFQPNDWVQTQFVFDDFGRLRYMLSPEAIKQSTPANWIYDPWTISQTIADGLCYKYVYDERGRVIEKKIPGKASEFIVYDVKDKPVLTADGNLKAAGKWNFIIYDILNRPIISGVYSSSATQQQLAIALSDASTYSAPDLLYYLKQASILNSYPASVNNCEVLVYTYYDDYLNLNNAAYNSSFDPLLTGAAPYVGTQLPSTHTRGLVTGTKVKVMDPAASVQWITTAIFYDDKGRLLQQQSNNIKNGTDIVTNQYDFAGTLVSSVTDHNNPQAGSWNNSPTAYQHLQVVKRFTKNYQSGVVTQIEQNINNVGWRTIHSLGFDDLNRLKNNNQSAADNYYDYNIRGWLTGINAAFIDNSSATNKYFYETLSYNDGFASKLYNGSIAGITWKAYGSGARKRCYGYTYDPLNRLQHAEFAQLDPNGSSSSWSKTQTDFTASGISYDYNGNILSMNQRGPGSSVPVDMDKLSYSYATGSNLLTSVSESNNGVFTATPDFKDGNTSGNDYDYDLNGNLKYDKNKGVNTAITYSYLDKPQHVVVDGRGTIDYIYDAVGNKLQKKVSPLSGAPTITDYIGPFVYENNKLQYMLHEEGRCRPQQNTNMATPTFDYDYFIKDHLGNVRSVVNAQPAGIGPQVQYNAGMELSMANVESLIWSQLDQVRTTKPGSIETSDTKAAELIGSDPDKRIGVALLLKAMPGDRFDLSAQTYYDAIGDNEAATPDDVAGSLIHALSGGTNYSGVPVAELPENIRTVENTIGNPGFTSAYNAVTSEVYDDTKPAAYLNYIVFDENFRVVKENSGTLQVSGAANQWNNLTTNGQITINQAGYIAVFASSQAANPVFFDKINMVYYKGTVLEENHYYPYGLTLTNPVNQPANEKNNYKLTTKELQDNFDLNWYDFGARMQDEQIGRWTSIDPLAEHAPGWTPFRYGFDNPVSTIDPNGMQEKGKDDQQGATGTSSNIQYQGFAIQDIVVTAKRLERGTQTVRLAQSAFDSYVQFHAATDPRPASQHTGNKYVYGAYLLSREIQEKHDLQKWIADKWAKSYAQTDRDMAKFGLIMVGAAVTIEFAPVIFSVGGTSLGSVFTASSIGAAGGNFTSQMLTNEGSFTERLNDVNWTGVASSAVFKNPFGAEYVGNAFKFTINDGFNGSFFIGNMTNSSKAMPASNFLVNVGVGGVFGKYGDMGLGATTNSVAGTKALRTFFTSRAAIGTVKGTSSAAVNTFTGVAGNEIQNKANE